jgi:hypothetical protein
MLLEPLTCEFGRHPTVQVRRPFAVCWSINYRVEIGLDENLFILCHDFVTK